ncbi:MAG: hypothetical protein FWH27_17560 [Planctomycetaceae bacterium]|nr:hypothetical protein [Planctomycetaceae bacterium]
MRSFQINNHVLIFLLVFFLHDSLFSQEKDVYDLSLNYSTGDYTMSLDIDSKQVSTNVNDHKDKIIIFKNDHEWKMKLFSPNNERGSRVDLELVNIKFEFNRASDAMPITYNSVTNNNDAPHSMVMPKPKTKVSLWLKDSKFTIFPNTLVFDKDEIISDKVDNEYEPYFNSYFFNINQIIEILPETKVAVEIHG